MVGRPFRAQGSKWFGPFTQAVGLGWGRSPLWGSRGSSTGPRSLEEWEQGRRRPESAVRAYLTVMDRKPEAVEEALTNKS